MTNYKLIILLLISLNFSIFADIKSAKKEYAKQHYKSALALFQDYSKKHPSDGESYLYQGYIYEHLKNFPKSIEMFKKATDSNLEKKNKITAYLKITIYYQYYKEWQNTLLYAEKLNKLSPGNLVAQKAMTAAEENNLNPVNNRTPSKDNPEEMISYYEKLILRFPENTKILWELSMLYYDQRQLANAENKLTNLIELENDNKNYLYKAGIVKIKLNKFKEGINLLSKSLELAEDNDKDLKYYSYFNRGNAYYNISMLDESEKDYKKAYTIKKKNIILMGLERIYYNKGNFIKLLSITNKILDSKPDNFESQLYNIYAKISLKNDVKLEDIDNILTQLKTKYNPFDSLPENYHNIILSFAKYYSSNNRYDDALFLFKVIYRTKGTASVYNFYRGKSHFYLNQYKEAIEYLNKINDSAAAKYLCAKAAATMNDLDNTRLFISQATALKADYWSIIPEEELFKKLISQSKPFKIFITNKGVDPVKNSEPLSNSMEKPLGSE